VKYISTRGDATQRGFSDILLEGLAPDGGLYLPTHYPQVDAATLARWRELPYHALAFEILSLYIDDIPADDLRALTAKTYTKAVFGSEQIAPITALRPGCTWKACRTARRSPSRTWRCSCSATCSNTNWAAAARR
jgi:threonine synthase